MCALGVCFLHSMYGFGSVDVPAAIGPFRAMVWQVARIGIGRFAVPVFLMLTGYLLLDPEREMGPSKIVSYLKRMGLLVLIFGFPYALVERLVGGEGFSLGLIVSSVRDVLAGDTWDHMWYLYALMGIYILLPLLRVFADRAERWQWAWMLGGLLVCTSLIPGLYRYFSLDVHRLVPISSVTLLYVLLGGWERQHGDDEDWQKVDLLGLASLGGLVLLCLWWIFGKGYPSTFIEDPTHPLMVFWSLAVFRFFRRIGMEPFGGNGRLQNAIELLSRDSLGIYIVSPILVNILYKGLGLTPLTAFPGMILIVWVAELAFGLAVTEGLRRLPVLHDLL